MRQCVYLLFFIILLLTPVSFVSAQKTHPAKAFDPFDDMPASSIPGCGQEQRYKYDVSIQSIDKLMVFLKKHQSSVDIHGFSPNEESFIPGYALDNVGNDPRKKINLDRFRSQVRMLVPKRSKLYNHTVYILNISNEDFEEVAPWNVLIKVSDQGHVSVIFCSGL